MLNFQHLKNSGLELIYNNQLISQPEACWFDASYWQDKNAILGGAPGRGTSLFIQTPQGEAVWRHYQRGGLPGKLIKDSYLWLGLHKTRAWQEFKLHLQLLELGLPVPQPLIAAVKRQGCIYTADLITLRLPQAVPFIDCLTSSTSPELLQAVGACIARFHAAGLNHTDLNPRNIMVNPETLAVWLIDFDRCSLGKPQAKTALTNLKRLARAFNKINPQLSNLWLTGLMAGYQP